MPEYVIIASAKIPAGKKMQFHVAVRLSVPPDHP